MNFFPPDEETKLKILKFYFENCCRADVWFMGAGGNPLGKRANIFHYQQIHVSLFFFNSEKCSENL